MSSKGNKISAEVKEEILLALEEVGCNVKALAARYGVSRSIVYCWRDAKVSEKASSGQVASKFVELREVELPGHHACLEKVSLTWGSMSITIDGKLKGSGLIALIKTLEKVC
jgi:transposase-like protein